VTAEGAVYDRSYRGYDGALGTRRTASLALYRASLRRALGLRRSWKQKIAPGVLLALACLPAAIQLGIAYLTKDTPVQDLEFVTYHDYLGYSTVLLLFVALTAPDLVCPDRRQRVLPLLLSRPLSGWDYAAVKVAAVTTLVFAFTVLPQLLLFLGQVGVADESLDYVRDNAEVLWQVPVCAALLSLFYGVLGVTAASLSLRRVVAAGALLGTLLVCGGVSEALVQAQGDTGSAGALVDLAALPLQLRDLIMLGGIGRDSNLYGLSGGGLLAVLAYVGVLGAGTAVLLRRFRTSAVWT
jgi:ABC-2 type transport system permease protein